MDGSASPCPRCSARAGRNSPASWPDRRHLPWPRRGSRPIRDRSRSALSQSPGVLPNSCAAAAARSASFRSVVRFVGWMASTASRRRRRSLVNPCRTSAALENEMIMAASLLPSKSIISMTLSFAWRSREPSTSVACMLAELSIKKIERAPSELVPEKPGRRQARMNSSTAISCSSRSKFLRSRCQILLTCRSSIARCQRKVLGTCTGWRRSFKKYSITIRGGTAARISH